MEYTYLSIYRFEGISDNNLDTDKILYEDKKNRVIVTLTKNISKHAYHLDFGNAVLKCIFHGKHKELNSQELKNLIEDDISNFQTERRSLKNYGAYVVIQFKGDEPVNIDESVLLEKDFFSLTFDALDKNVIIDKHAQTIRSILLGISINSNPDELIIEELSGIYFGNANRPLYSLTGHVGSVRAIAATPLEDQHISVINSEIKASLSCDELKTPSRLYKESHLANENKLRAFLSAWSAIEIFVNKIFESYERTFIEELKVNNLSEGMEKYILRIEKVMNGKYNPRDKFHLIASFLNLDDEIETFIELQKTRNEISHGQEFSESDLKLDSARRLAAKLFKKHLAHIGKNNN